METVLNAQGSQNSPKSDAIGCRIRPSPLRLGPLAGVRIMTGVGVALGAVGFVMTGEPLWIAAGAAAGATLEWLQRSKS